MWDELKNTGSYHVREAYIRSKNGPISDYYLELYRWYTLRCRSYLAIPEGLSYPIWLALSEETRLPDRPRSEKPGPGGKKNREG